MTKLKKIIFIVALVAIAILIAILFFKPIIKYESDDQQEIVEPQIIFGFNVDTLNVHNNTVKANEFLANILQGYNVDYGTIDKLVRETRDVFDVRKIRKGNNYSVITTKDSIPKAKYFIYEI